MTIGLLVLVFTEHAALNNAWEHPVRLAVLLYTAFFDERQPA